MEEEVKKNNIEIEEIESGVTGMIDILDENVLDEASTTLLQNNDDIVLGACTKDFTPCDSCLGITCTCDILIDCDDCFSDGVSTTYWLLIWSADLWGQKRSDGWCRYPLNDYIDIRPTTLTAYTSSPNSISSGTGLYRRRYFWKSGSTTTTLVWTNGGTQSLSNSRVGAINGSPTMPYGHAWTAGTVIARTFTSSTITGVRKPIAGAYGYTPGAMTRFYVNQAQYRIKALTPLIGASKAGCSVKFYNANNAVIKAGYTYSDGACIIYSGSTAPSVWVYRPGDAIYSGKPFSVASGGAYQYAPAVSANGYQILRTGLYTSNSSIDIPMVMMMGYVLPSSSNLNETAKIDPSLATYKSVFGDGVDTSNRLAAIHNCAYGASARTVTSSRTSNGVSITYLDESVATASTPSALTLTSPPPPRFICLKNPTYVSTGYYTFTGLVTSTFYYGENQMRWPSDGIAMYNRLGKRYPESIRASIYVQTRTGSSTFYKWVPAKVRLTRISSMYSLDDGGGDEISGNWYPTASSNTQTYGKYLTTNNDLYSSSGAVSTFSPGTSWYTNNPNFSLVYSGSGYDGSDYGGDRVYADDTWYLSLSAKNEYSSASFMYAYSACVLVEFAVDGNASWYYQH